MKKKPDNNLSAAQLQSFEMIFEQLVYLSITVPQMACFFKMLVDNNLLEVKNKSEFCRRIADLFQSSGNDNLSWRSFKNHFDSPSPDSIRFCQEEFLSLSKLAARFFEEENS